MKLPQLTLRDLFWLVLVVGMGLGWWLDQRSYRLAYRSIADEYLDYYLETENELGKLGPRSGYPTKRIIRELLAPLDRELDRMPRPHPSF